MTARRRRPGTEICSLLDLDPSLACLEPGETPPLEWRARTAALCESHEPGPWSPSPEAGGFGHLLVRGTLMLRFAVGERRSTELFARGDVIAPHAWGSPIEETAWIALSGCTLARLDETFARRAAAVPGVCAALLGRSQAVVGRLSYRLMIANCTRLEQSLMLLFELFAERWGTVSAAGKHIPLPLTHSQLAELVCAQRPSVTSAISRLTAAGRLRRDPAGWVLAPAAVPGPLEASDPVALGA